MKSEWVIIDVLPHETLARLWRDRLAQEKIPCRLQRVEPIAATGTRANFAGGTEVLVKREDIVTARRVLGINNSRRHEKLRKTEVWWLRYMLLSLACGAGGLTIKLTHDFARGVLVTLLLAGALLLWSRN